MSGIQGLFPCAGEHAILTAAVKLEWNEPLQAPQFEALRSAASQLRDDFPDWEDQHRVTINMTPGRMSAPQQSLGGFVLTRTAPSAQQPARTVMIDQESLQVVVGDYSEWKKVRADVVRYLGVLLPHVARGIQGLGLQYQDVFDWRDDPAKLPVKRIFMAGSKFLVGNALDLDGLWHSHHGYFEDFDAPKKCRELNNINVSRVVRSGTQSIQAITSHLAIFESPLWVQGDVGEGSPVFEILERMHIKNKSILAELFSSEVQDMINLNRKREAHAN